MTIEAKNFGKIEKIDIVPKTHHTNGETYNAMFVHFEKWNNNSETIEFQRQVRDPNFKSIVYTGYRQYFWHVSEHITKIAPTKVVDEDLTFYKSKYIMMLDLVRSTERMIDEKDAENYELYNIIHQLKVRLGDIVEDVLEKKVEPEYVEEVTVKIEVLDEDDDDEDDEEANMFKTKTQIYYEYEVEYMKEKAQEQLKRELQLYLEYEREYMNILEQEKIAQFEKQIYGSYNQGYHNIDAQELEPYESNTAFNYEEVFKKNVLDYEEKCMHKKSTNIDEFDKREYEYMFDFV